MHVLLYFHITNSLSCVFATTVTASWPSAFHLYLIVSLLLVLLVFGLCLPFSLRPVCPYSFWVAVISSVRFPNVWLELSSLTLSEPTPLDLSVCVYLLPHVPSLFTQILILGTYFCVECLHCVYLCHQALRLLILTFWEPLESGATLPVTTVPVW